MCVCVFEIVFSNRKGQRVCDRPCPPPSPVLLPPARFLTAGRLRRETHYRMTAASSAWCLVELISKDWNKYVLFFSFSLFFTFFLIPIDVSIAGASQRLHLSEVAGFLICFRRLQLTLILYFSTVAMTLLPPLFFRTVHSCRVPQFSR